MNTTVRDFLVASGITAFLVLPTAACGFLEGLQILLISVYTFTGAFVAMFVAEFLRGDL